MIDLESAPAWVYEVISLARLHPRLEIGFITDHSLIKEKPVRLSFLHRFFNRLDGRRAPDDGARSAFSKQIVINAGIPTGSIQELMPDIVWQIGGGQISETMLPLVPYGIWYYHSRGGFREVYESKDSSEMTLEVIGIDQGGVRRIGTSQVRTHPSSPAINSFQLELSGKRLLLDAIERLVAHEWSPGEFFARHPASASDRNLFTPSNIEMMKFATSVLLPSMVRTRLESKWLWQWTVGMMPWDNNDSYCCIRVQEAQWITPPNDGFLADPFVWRYSGDLFVFFEEVPFSKGRGHISVASWSKEAGFGQLKSVLVEDYHLSYPFLFEFESKLYMMPESHMAGDLWAYECIEFPLNWQKFRRVIDECCVDGTLLQHGGRWWLFYSRATGEISEDNLYAFHAATPFGPWTQHPMNPICSGLRGSRMAGNFVVEPEGRLIRPAQDCTSCYGGSLVFFEVEELTPDSYRENEIAIVKPTSIPAPWNARCHTFNLADKVVVIDACRRTMRPHNAN